MEEELEREEEEGMGVESSVRNEFMAVSRRTKDAFSGLSFRKRRKKGNVKGGNNKMTSQNDFFKLFFFFFFFFFIFFFFFSSLLLLLPLSIPKRSKTVACKRAERLLIKTSFELHSEE